MSHEAGSHPETEPSLFIRAICICIFLSEALSGQASFAHDLSLNQAAAWNATAFCHHNLHHEIVQYDVGCTLQRLALSP